MRRRHGIRGNGTVRLILTMLMVAGIVLCSVMVSAVKGPVQATQSETGEAVKATESLAAGMYHSLLVRSDGTLWAWGSNDKGQLGLGNTTSPITTPTKVGTATNWL